MTPARVRCAVVGLGYWGPNLARNFATSRRTELSVLCDSRPARLETIGAAYPAARRETSVGNVLSDCAVDAVAVATPVASHYAIASAALQAGKHVLVEKPMAASSQEAQALVSLAQERGRVLLVDHVFLYTPAVRKIAELMEKGELGKIHYFDSVRINLGLFQHDVDVVWDLAPHDLSIIDQLVGRPPRSVSAIGAVHTSSGLADTAYLHLDYGEGLLASVHVNWLSPVKIRHFLVGGSRKSLLYNELDASERVKVYDRGIDVTEDPEGVRQALISYRSGDVVSPRLEPTEALHNLIEHFADCVEGKARPLSCGDQGLRIVRILEAAGKSMASGGTRIEL